MSLFLPGTIGFQRLWATTLGSRSAAADRLAIIARNARPDAPAAYSYACTRLPLSQVLLAPRTSAFVYNGNQWALPPPNSFRALKTRGPIFGEPARAVDRNWQAGDGRLLFEYLPKVIEPTLRSRARRLPGWPIATCTASHDFGSDRSNSGHAVDIAETTWMILSRHRVR